ncbi:MAG: iron-sulfur cluster assembly protein [Rikenellaceae bacterium]
MATIEEILRMESDIVLTLKNIYDPEIPVNIYDLGLVYEIDVEPSGEAFIRMTLTAPNCPMADQIIEQVNSDVLKVNGITSVNVTLTFELEWNRDMISEEALLDLGWL